MRLLAGRLAGRLVRLLAGRLAGRTTVNFQHVLRDDDDTTPVFPQFLGVSSSSSLRGFRKTLDKCEVGQSGIRRFGLISESFETHEFAIRVHFQSCAQRIFRSANPADRKIFRIGFFYKSDSRIGSGSTCKFRGLEAIGNMGNLGCEKVLPKLLYVRQHGGDSGSCTHFLF